MTVRMFTLSTCGHCRAAKRFMEDNAIDFQFIDVDLLTGEQRKNTIEELTGYNPARSFPTILIGDSILVGFNESKLREALGI
ncbi:MAG: glutaredoxin family protein [Syntrophales bacterium]|nr:glutaredoxin family protein [Syntrophales bacterium]